MQKLNKQRLRQNADKLFALQPKLADFVFDNKGKIDEQIRQKILFGVNDVCKKILLPFEAVSISEIYLAGSAASYLWKKSSDFDVWVKIKINYERFFIKNHKHAIEFLREYFRQHYPKKYQFYINGKKIDIILTDAFHRKMYGIYNLGQNKWLKKPSQNLLEGQDKTDVIEAASALYNEICNEIDSLKRDAKGRLKLSTIRRLHNKHNKIVLSQYNGVRDYLIFKLLRYENINLLFRKFHRIETAKSLSITIYQTGLKLKINKLCIDEKQIWQIICDLLTPQPCLFLSAFDIYGNIIEDVRQQLLQKSNLIFNKLFGKYDGIKIEEIYLSGSAASYMWTDKSDFDIAIRVGIDPNKFVIKDCKKAIEFLNSSRVRDEKVIYSPTVNNKFLDLRFYAEQPKKLYGLYSLSNDAWVVKPKMYLTENIRPQQVFERVCEIVNEINLLLGFVESEKNQGKIIKKLQNYFNKFKNRQYHNILEYMAFKVLKKANVTNNFKHLVETIIANVLSIKDYL